MKPGDLVRVTYRDLIYTNRRGGNFLCTAGLGEIMLVLDDSVASGKVKVLHPIHGPGFITRYYTEVISETR